MKKTLIHFIFALSFLSGMAFLTSCGGDSQEGDHDQTEQHEHGDEDGEHTHAEGEDHDHGHGDAEETVDKTGPEYTSAYVCPMHCEGSGSDEAGKCPVCGMDYVASADAPDGDGHDHDDEGHHEDGEGGE